MTTSQSITGYDLLTLMLDYNFLRASCMLAPDPKGFFIGSPGGLSRWGSSGRADIFELYLWWLKHKIPPRDLFSPHRSPKKPIMGVGGGERGGWVGRKVGSHYSFISFLSAPENAPTSEEAQKCQIKGPHLSQKWVSTIWSRSASIHQLSPQRRQIWGRKREKAIMFATKAL